MLQLMSARGLRGRSRPDDSNVIRKGGRRQRKDVEQLRRVLRNDDGMSLDSEVHSISSASTSLKTNDAARHVTSSDDDGVDPRQAPQLRWLKVGRLTTESEMIGESVGGQLPHPEMLVTGSTKVHVAWTLD